jgi:hypothetical protein
MSTARQFVDKFRKTVYLSSWDAGRIWLSANRDALTHVGLRPMQLAARGVELVKLSAPAAPRNQFASCGIKAVALPRWSANMSSADSPLSVISFTLVWTRRKG